MQVVVQGCNTNAFFIRLYVRKKHSGNKKASTQQKRIYVNIDPHRKTKETKKNLYTYVYIE